MRDQQDHIFILYYLAIYTGMRRGELLGLKWGDIDFDKRRIHIRHALYYIAGQGLVLQSPKTSSGKRNISITDDVIAELQAYKIKKTGATIKSRIKVKQGSFYYFSVWRRTFKPQYNP
jgi:integrase